MRVIDVNENVLISFLGQTDDAVLHSSVEVVSILNPGVKTYIVA